MLKVTVTPRVIAYDESRDCFIKCNGGTITLEHSLVSVSKWEALYHKPFLNKQQKTQEEWLDYIKFMTITQNVDPSLYLGLTGEDVDRIIKYIDDPMTATTFSKTDSKSSGTFLTNEVIYYTMFKYGIPKECEKWHLNRLITLIEVFNHKEAPQQKKSQQQMWSEMDAINKARRAKWKTKG